MNDDMKVSLKEKKSGGSIRKVRDLLLCGALGFINSLADSLPRNIAILSLIFLVLIIGRKKCHSNLISSCNL